MSSPSSIRWVDPMETPAAGREPYVRIFKCTVFVRDQDRSLRFYVDQLGFRLVADVSFTPAGRWVAVAPPDGSAVLVLIKPEAVSEDAKQIGKESEIAFITDDVNATYEAWHKRGVIFRRSPQQSNWGGVHTQFEDPDGNAFTLLGFDESTRQIEERRREIAERQEFERLVAQEIEIAKQVQARLFPQNLPALRTLDYAGICSQARAVGGEYYDFLNLGRGRIGLVIGDISGKGIAAALLMANLQASVRSQCAIALDHPEAFLQAVNRLFFDSTTDGAYATLFFAEYDDEARRLRYANCGHLPALLLRRDESVERLESTGTVLGLFEAWECAIRERAVEPGDVLALYTDGVTEAFGDADEEFGERRLIDAMKRHRELAPQAMLAAVVNDVRAFAPREQSDDITLIIARCK
jgi:serine phosphatase RsbU (regulator of sigma subunit)/catechol 2,3-dioxygenase-like lactoylglutathione lyase family enzyme